MEAGLVGQHTIVMHSKGKKPWMHHIAKRPTTVGLLVHRDGVILGLREGKAYMAMVYKRQQTRDGQGMGNYF